MLKTKRKELCEWFDKWARSLPTYGTATMQSKWGEDESYADWLARTPLIPAHSCYGHNIKTVHGPLTFKLDLCQISKQTHVTLFAKFWNTDELPGIINGLQTNTYSGKWNLHFGAIADNELHVVQEEIKRVLNASLVEAEAATR